MRGNSHDLAPAKKPVPTVVVKVLVAGGHVGSIPVVKADLDQALHDALHPTNWTRIRDGFDL